MIIAQRVRAFWDRLDAKLKAVIVAVAVTQVAIRVGLNPDEVLEALELEAPAVDVGYLTSLVVALVAAYKTPNEGTLLREEPIVAADAGGVDLSAAPAGDLELNAGEFVPAGHRKAAPTDRRPRRTR